MSPEAKDITTRAFFLCIFGSMLVFGLVAIGVLCGHDGMVLVTGVAAIAGMVAGVSGFTLGRLVPPK